MPNFTNSKIPSISSTNSPSTTKSSWLADYSIDNFHLSCFFPILILTFPCRRRKRSLPRSEAFARMISTLSLSFRYISKSQSKTKLKKNPSDRFNKSTWLFWIIWQKNTHPMSFSSTHKGKTLSSKTSELPMRCKSTSLKMMEQPASISSNNL